MSGRVWTGRASENKFFFFRRLEFIGSCCYCLAKELILQAEYDRCEVSCGPHEYTRRDARSSHAELAVGEETTEALAVPVTYKALAGAVLAEHSCDQQKKKKEKKNASEQDCDFKGSDEYPFQRIPTENFFKFPEVLGNLSL